MTPTYAALMGTQERPERPRWRQALSRLVASQNEMHAEHEQELAVKAGGTLIATLPLRRPQPRGR